MDIPTAPHPLLAEPTLVVRQRAKLFELRNEYAVLDQHGRQIGSVAQVNQSLIALLSRVISSLDVALPITLELRDAAGTPVLVIDKAWLRWSLQVRQPGGAVLGTIGKRARLGKARFVMRDAAGRTLGHVKALNWRARTFSVRDEADREVARVTKKWEGFAKAIFTDADNYVVQVSPGVGDPLRSLAVASCLVIDVIMKQKDTN